MINWADLVPDNISLNNKLERYVHKTRIDPDILEPVYTFDKNEKNDICKSCNNKFFISNDKLICKSCGVEVPNITTYCEEDANKYTSQNCNVKSEGYTSIKVVGKCSKSQQKNMLRTCAVYSNFSKRHTLRHMNNWNNHAADDPKNIFIPKHVIRQAHEEFNKIKEKKYVYRNEGKDGVLSGLIYYACYEHNITKTPAEIARFCGIEEKFHSQGIRILHQLNEKGIINIPVKIYPIPDYIDRYFDILNINAKYKQFILDIIKRAEKKKIHVLHDSKATTRVVGSIYLLTTRVKELKDITKEKIEELCEVRKITFIKYASIIHQYYKKFKLVFKRHRIPMPISWKKVVE